MFQPTPENPTGKAGQEVSDNGRVTVYENGRVLYQPPGMTHEQYKAGLKPTWTLSDFARAQKGS